LYSSCFIPIKKKKKKKKERPRHMYKDMWRERFIP
jgi:hypothetical protein